MWYLPAAGPPRGEIVGQPRQPLSHWTGLLYGPGGRTFPLQSGTVSRMVPPGVRRNGRRPKRSSAEQSEATSQGERSTPSDPFEMSPTWVAYGRCGGGDGSEDWGHLVQSAQLDPG